MSRTASIDNEAAWRSVELDRTGPVAAEEIAARMQDLIVSAEIPEGDRLPSERDLAEMLGVSRPTVSQAVRILVVRGLVESRRGSGAYVVHRPLQSLTTSVNLMLSLDESSVTHLNDLRLGLETMGVEQAIVRGTPSDIMAGELALEQLRESCGDTAAWMSADTKFHATVVGASCNPYLVSMFESVHATLIDFEYRNWVARGTVPVWLEESAAEALTAIHDPILQAVKDKNPAAARIAVLTHHQAMADHLAQALK